MNRSGPVLMVAALLAACSDEPPAPEPQTSNEAAAIAKAEAMLDEPDTTKDAQ